MNYYFCLILLIISYSDAYPHLESNEQEKDINERVISRRQIMFPPVRSQQQQQQQQQLRQGLPSCLPPIWRCGPGLPPCCYGLMCYNGNAKRGQHCVARG